MRKQPPRSAYTQPRRPKRRRRPVHREGFRLAGLAIVAWLLVSGLVGWEAFHQPSGDADAPSVREIQIGAQLTSEPLLGPAIGMWWSLDGEPVGGVSTKADRITAHPAPTPVVSDDLNRLIAQLPGDTEGTARTIPILYYHHPPEDFDQQLTYLEQHSYTVIDLDQLVLGLAGGPLPLKPVAITFDDGFADQMQAYDALKAHDMKATFYIINGSAASTWCIGAGRRYNDPLQPPQGCGDAYLTWDQVKQLDKSGLITIGGHTLDHFDLSSLTPDQQYHEIADSKTQIEAELGHAIHHFAYPYGTYNHDTIAAVQKAGYLTAVTTLAGNEQTYSRRYELVRQRTAYVLP